jgi:hypothetical protein
MSSGTQGKGATPTGNQPTTATRGGASAYPTPANNSGGGAGWGDSGIIKGGLEGIVRRPIYFPSPSPQPYIVPMNSTNRPLRATASPAAPANPQPPSYQVYPANCPDSASKRPPASRGIRVTLPRPARSRLRRRAIRALRSASLGARIRCLGGIRPRGLLGGRFSFFICFILVYKRCSGLSGFG